MHILCGSRFLLRRILVLYDRCLVVRNLPIADFALAIVEANYLWT